MTTKRTSPLPILALASLIFSPVTGFAQSILLSAGNFTLLGGTAITSTGVVGTTIRNGNVGLAPGATTGITGFPPAVIVGGAIIATGSVTGQARLDLITASVGLAGMPSNANMSSVDLGGKTLAPGVYTFNAAASLNGALVLDAQGRNNVAWVFQIGTALTTSINSSVIIINPGSNGGKDDGIFWNAGSAVVVGANNQIAGNYLAGTSITFGSIDSGGGRALALAGISLDNDIIDATGGLAGSDYTGGLRYNPSGAVVFGGGSGTTTTIASGTADGGIGTFGGNLSNSGTLSPGIAGSGFQAGTVNISGNFAQTPSGTLVIQLTSGTAFDQVVVAGTAALAGTLQVDTLGSFDPVGLSFPIITAAGGVSGTFGTVMGSAISNRAAVAATVIYGANGVTVAFSQLPFTGFALTPNQHAIALAAQASPALTTVLDDVPLASQLPGAFNALSPQGYEIWSEIAFAHATALADRLGRDDHTVPGRDDYYFDVSQRRGRTQGDFDVGTSTFTTTSGLVGGNHNVSPDLIAGGFLDYSNTTADLGSSGSRTTVKDIMPGVRFAWTEGPWFEQALLGYGFEDYSSTRPIVFPGTSAVAMSSTHGHQWLADLSVGQHFTNGAATLSPFAGIVVSRWQANGFTETGAGAFNATVADQSANSLRSQLGLEVRTNIGILQPHLRAAWLHEFSNGARTIDSSFGSVNYAVSTRRPKRDSALLSAGLDFGFGSRAVLYTDYAVETGSITKILGEWRVGLSVNF